MVNLVVIFCICSLINVILSTLKTLIMFNSGEKMAILINAVCYGFYMLVVKQVGDVDYMTAVTVTVLANIVGVWLSYRIMDLFKKDKLWRITVTLKTSRDVDVCEENLQKYNIGCTRVKDSTSIDIYSYNQKESAIIKSILANYDYKYFIQEMAKKL